MKTREDAYLKPHITFDSCTRTWIACKDVDGHLYIGIGLTPTAAFQDCCIELEMATSDIHQ